MYLFDDTYNGMVSYLMGYLYAVMEITEEDVSDEFQKWLVNKVGSSFSTHWSNYIYVEMAKKDEKTAKEILLNLLEDFFNSRKQNT